MDLTYRLTVDVKEALQSLCPSCIQSCYPMTYLAFDLTNTSNLSSASNWWEIRHRHRISYPWHQDTEAQVMVGLARGVIGDERVEEKPLHDEPPSAAHQVGMGTPSF